MRILAAIKNYSQAAELVNYFADVEIVAIASSYADALRTAREEQQEGRDVDALILSDSLRTDRDKRNELSLRDVIRQMREMFGPGLIIIVNFSSSNVDTLQPQDLQLYNVLTVVGENLRIEGSPIQNYLHLKRKEQLATTIAVFGLKGGIGRTTVALNLASSLITPDDEKRDHQILLWDMNLKTSSLQSLFPQLTRNFPTLADALNGESFHWRDLKQNIYPNSQSRMGFDILFAPESVRDVMSFYRNNNSVQRLQSYTQEIFRELRNYYRIIIADCGTDVFANPLPSMVMDAAKAIIYVVDSSQPGVRSFENFRDVIVDMNWSGKTHILVNRAKLPNHTEAKVIEQEIGQGIPVMGEFPDEPVVMKEIGGQFIVRNKGKSAGTIKDMFTKFYQELS